MRRHESLHNTSCKELNPAILKPVKCALYNKIKSCSVLRKNQNTLYIAIFELPNFQFCKCALFNHHGILNHQISFFKVPKKIVFIHVSNHIRNKHCTKMEFSIKDFFSKCNQIRSFLRIWSHLLKKSLMKNFILCAVKFDQLASCLDQRRYA